MAADVSTLGRMLNGYKDDRTVGNRSADGRTTLITRDLLGSGGGGSSKIECQELDLDLQVPNGWEKCLDLKSGKVYLQRRNTRSNSTSSSSQHHRHQTNQTVPKLQDLNFLPSTTKATLNLFDDGNNLELKLVSSSAIPSLLSSSSSSYQSVCTLDKVKSALERADTEPLKKRSSSLWKPSLSPNSRSSSSSSPIFRENNIQEHENEEKLLPLSPVAAVGCPGCLSYVLIVKSNPRCPRCNSVVLMPAMKKPRIDLNISI